MSLVFYDTETTGTETFFDQILQFAAIQTDEQLNEIDRFEIRCRLLPHVVPAPGAMSVTGAKVSQLTDPSFPSHYEMVRAIRAKLLSWSPALFTGWNSIKFDENLIRQALYKTLHNPYLTNSVGNSRSDIMRIVQACSLFAPDALSFPTDDNGQTVFKLDQIAPANGFIHDRAHDAMGDVEATIFLCRLLIEKAPHIWSSFMRFSTKAAVSDYITNEPVFCTSDFYFGRPYSYIVTTIGQNQENDAEWYVYDLSVDPESLLSFSVAQLTARIAQSPKPVRRVKSNAAPMLFPAEDAPVICKGRECGLEELERRAAMLQKDVTLRQRLISALESQKEGYPPSAHIEKQIYDGFVEKPDAILMDSFHEVAWPERHAIVEKFQDPRLKTIGRQLIHLERPDLLDKSTCRKHDLAAAKRLLGQGEDIPWLTLPKALEQLEEMLEGASGPELELLREHEQYLRKRHEQALTRVKYA
ncbi:MAG TPA: exonuclease domain-containing protein [Opitutaceae bacterium]|jgi:exodeoxyribonuclease-1|nr:exonuclease domain-containing protein [Opitutaceae bacterium]